MVPDEVRTIGRYVYSQAQALSSALNSAGQAVDQLTSGGWAGDAAQSFGRGWSECQDGGGKIIDTLTELAAKLGVTATSYLDRDTDTAGKMSSLDL